MTFFILALLIMAGFYGFRYLYLKQIARNYFFREELTDAKVYNQFFLHSNCEESDVIMLWHEIADTLKVPAGKLRPTDQFGKDIGADLITTGELDVLGLLGQARAKKMGREVNFQDINTVYQYVQVLSRKRSIQ